MEISFTIQSDKGLTARVFVDKRKGFGISKNMQAAIICQELQKTFCRIFDTPIVKVVASHHIKSSIEEHHRLLLERDRALLAEYEQNVEAIKQRIETMGT